MLTKNLSLEELSNKQLSTLINELSSECIQCGEKILQYDSLISFHDKRISESEKEIHQINNLIKDAEYFEYELECDLKFAQAELYFREENSICKYTPAELEEAGQLVLFEGQLSH